MTDDQTRDEPASDEHIRAGRVEEVWTFAGRRESDGKRYYAWQDGLGQERYYAKLQAHTIGGRYAVLVTRTFLRLFVDSGSMIRASVYHLHPRGVVLSMLQLVQLYPRHLRVIELVSEVQGAFLVTSNTHGIDRLEPPPEARIERLPLSTPLDDIVKRHEGRITELLRAHPERTPVHFEAYDDVLASMARAHVAMARHRQKVGGLSRDELERLKGRPLSTSEEAFLREVQGKTD